MKAFTKKEAGIIKKHPKMLYRIKNIRYIT
jgi:hypothetical protein